MNINKTLITITKILSQPVPIIRNNNQNLYLYWIYNFKNDKEFVVWETDEKMDNFINNLISLNFEVRLFELT